MSDDSHYDERHDNAAPGDDHASTLKGVQGYVLGLILATGLTAASSWAASTHLLRGPGVPIGLCLLAIA